jgi:hypothetical protein
VIFLVKKKKSQQRYVWTLHWALEILLLLMLQNVCPKGSGVLQVQLKGLSHEILGLFYDQYGCMNCFCFKNYYDSPSIFGSYFKFWCVSYQTFSEILQISEND